MIPLASLLIAVFPLLVIVSALKDVTSFTIPNCISLALASPVRGDEKPPAEPQAKVSFAREIAPLLAKHCVACHGPKKPEGDFQLHTFARLMKTGASELPPIAVVTKYSAPPLRSWVPKPAGDSSVARLPVTCRLFRLSGSVASKYGAW